MTTFLETIPALPTSALERGLAFYRDLLGFVVLYTDSSFASLKREQTEIHLWLASDESWKNRNPVNPIRSGAESFLAGTASCRIRVNGIGALYTELEPLKVVHPDGHLETKSWGNQEFAVSDPDGNLVTFFEKVGATHNAA